MDLLERIRDRIEYSPDSGELTWRPPVGKQFSGKHAGYAASYGYRKVKVLGRVYFVHRLAFLLMNGALPSKEIDHINGNRADNRWSNLRESTHAENMQNLKKAKRSNNSSGLLGVAWRERGAKWSSQIRVDGRIRHIGYFKTAEEAHQAYLAAKREHHPGCTI